MSTTFQASPLTKEEKVAGRAFRDEQSRVLLAEVAADPPTFIAPNFLALWRHECPGRRNVSTAIELKEAYVLSPEYVVVYAGGDGPEAWTTDQHQERTQDPSKQGRVDVLAVVPQGRFGFIYKVGKCRAQGCGATVKSRAGRLVDAYDRPPVEGRVARRSR